jgi:hypothetical protein
VQAPEFPHFPYLFGRNGHRLHIWVSMLRLHLSVWSEATCKGRAGGKSGILACMHRIASPGRFFQPCPLILIHYRYSSDHAMLCRSYILGLSIMHHLGAAAAVTPEPGLHSPGFSCRKAGVRRRARWPAVRDYVLTASW